MLKSALICASLGALALSLTLPVHAAAPAKISTVAPVADLIPEAEDKIKLLEESLANNQSYADARQSKIPGDAGVLAILAQAIAESDEDSPWKGKAAAVRDGALAVRNATSFDQASKGLTAIKDAIAGKPAEAKVEADWKGLCKLGPLMTEINRRQGKLRLATRRMPPFPPDAPRHASVLAVLCLAAHADTHEVKDKKDVPEWEKYALELQKQMTDEATALRKNDADAAKKLFTEAGRSCSACHDKFKPEN